jgi:hypothetical protein
MELAERRLEQVYRELADIPSAEREQVQAYLEAPWQTRLLGLLEEDPEGVTDLRALVDQVQAQLPTPAVSTSGQGVTEGRDVHIAAPGGGVVGRTDRGDIAPGSPGSPDTKA